MKASFSPEQVKRYLVHYHHLTPETQLHDPHETAAFVRKVGCIQFDPLEAAGRNADLVMQSRMPGYKRGDLSHWLYTERMLFDVWDKNMAICTVEDWPYFHRFRNRYVQLLKDHKKSVAKITAYLRKNEYGCSSDFGIEGMVEYWGTRRLATHVIEWMCYAGLAIVHHKRGTRRYYALAERFIPEHIYNAPDPNPGDADYHDWLVLRRINSIGMLWNRPGDAWLGIYDFKSPERNATFARLLKAKRIVEIPVEGLKWPLYIDRENLPLLESCPDEAPPECRIIAPLDNFVWERKLLAALFNFDYKWEVYVPAAQRQYGYYVMPVLYGHDFIGRIEFNKDGSVKNFWPENPKGLNKAEKQALKNALKRFAGYLG